jgi:hypothetical protein
LISVRQILMEMSRWERSITSKMQGKKLQCGISLAQRIEPGRTMMWSDVDILFGPKDHLDTELSDRNLSFVVKIPIGRHKMTKTLIDSRVSLNLMMSKTFIEMGLNLAELTPVKDTFHMIIPGQSSTPIGHIDLEVSCRSGENKRREMLTFEVASFDIGYNCILGWRCRRPALRVRAAGGGAGWRRASRRRLVAKCGNRRIFPLFDRDEMSRGRTRGDRILRNFCWCLV